MATQNKRINQFNTDTNLTGSELVLMMDNGVTKNMELTDVKAFVLSGITNLITGNTNNNSVLVGGVGNIVNPLANNSVVIGGVGISGTSSNTVYLPKLNINNLITGDTINNLGFDSNGNIIISDLFAISDLGFIVTPKSSKVINQNIILPDNSNVTYKSPLTMAINNTIVVPTNTILTII
jgi:hypothetical protein